MKKTKKLLICLLTIVLAVVIASSSAFACTMLYVGSDLTDTGDTYMSRSEDYSNSYNKLAYVSPHGKYLAGQTYVGCTFTFTFEHDSYAYTAVRDDNLDGECPNCGGTHDHMPMEEGGTNEMGVSVSAMDSVYSNNVATKVDPYKSARKGDTNYLSEGDMNTVLLAQCATAKEAVDLLCSIYDTYGVSEGSGLQISDPNETWYVENYSGTQYIAIKLSDSVVAFNANVGIIGLVDLDDTENVIASENVIAVAVEAGCFVGDEEANIIDFRASYSSPSINSRVWNGLNYLTGTDKYSQENTTASDFTVSNVKGGQIVPFFSKIQLKEGFGLSDMVDFYKVTTIGKSGNLEWHIFQLDADETNASLATVEWLGMNHGGYSVAIPYFPLLTTELYEGYMFGGVGGTKFVSELPEDATGYYPAVNRKGVQGFYVYPEGWENGVYWANDLLSNYADSAACSAEDNALIKAKLAEMQQKCYDKAAEMEAKIPTLSADEAKAYATAESKALAKEAHELAVALYKDIVFGEHVTAVDEAVAATCTVVGKTEGSHCAICGEVLTAQEEVAALGHKEVVDEAVAATCTEAGKTEGKHCSVCNEVLVEQKEVAALGHELVHHDAKAATTKEIGWDAYDTCKNCDYTTYKEIPVLEVVMNFTDIDADFWAYNEIKYVFGEGLMKGVSDTQFAPDRNMTRAMFVTVLYRLAGCPSIEGMTESFTDVAEDYWAYDAIVWGYNKGIIKGFDGSTFAPDQSITRAQLVVMLYRYVGSPEVSGELSVKDAADIASVYQNAVLWATQNGVVSGYKDGCFHGDYTATRAHMAAILARYLDK